MFRTSSVAVIALLLVTGISHGQETYTIKLGKPKQGDTQLVEKTTQKEESNKIFDPNGQVLKDETKKSQETFVYRETILEMPPDAPKATRLRRQYEKAEKVVNGAAQDLNLQGKSVLIEKKAGAYEFRLESGESLTAAAQQLLNDAFNKKGDQKDDREMEKLFLPQRPVKAGETWSIDLSVFEKAFAKDEKLKIDAGKSKATGKLLRAFKKDGRQFGELEFRLDMVPTGLTAGGTEMTVEPGSKIGFVLRAEMCIDGSSPDSSGTAVVEGNLALLVPLPDGTKIRATVQIKEKQSGKTTTVQGK